MHGSEYLTSLNLIFCIPHLRPLRQHSQVFCSHHEPSIIVLCHGYGTVLASNLHCALSPALTSPTVTSDIQAGCVPRESTPQWSNPQNDGNCLVLKGVVGGGVVGGLVVSNGVDVGKGRPLVAWGVEVVAPGVDVGVAGVVLSSAAGVVAWAPGVVDSVASVVEACSHSRRPSLQTAIFSRSAFTPQNISMQKR